MDRQQQSDEALSWFFKVPRSTAYGWLAWFESLPEGLRSGILAFMDTQLPIVVACQMPLPVPGNDPDAISKAVGQGQSS